MSVKLIRSLQGAGKTLAHQTEIKSGQEMYREASVQKAQAGTLTAANTVTMATVTHGLLNGGRVDVYWAGGSRRGLAVGIPSSAVVPLTGGTGDTLPSVTVPPTAVIVAVAEQFDFLFDGTDLKALAFTFAASAGLRGTFVLAIASNAEQYSAVVTSGGLSLWTSEDGTANPVVGDAIARLFMSHEDTTAARTMSALAAVT